MPDDMTSSNDMTSGGDDFEATEAILRSLTVEDLEPAEAPPSSVWDAIAAELGDELADAPDLEETPPTPPQAPVITADAEVIDLASRRRRNWTILSVAAAFVIVVVGAAVFVGRDTGGEVLASADLEYDEANFDPLGDGRSATADLVDTDGALTIDLAQADLPADLAEDADLELWLIAPDDSGQVADLVSLGLVDADDPGSFDVPDGYDPNEFFVVDISVEPRDGVETHSGRSILRGPLATA